METGKFELRPDSMALQIQHDASGKVTGVLYADNEGTHQLQKARIVCVAGNSIESPRLLLDSASNLFKDGMANFLGSSWPELFATRDPAHVCNFRAAHCNQQREHGEHVPNGASPPEMGPLCWTTPGAVL
jgi:hypothetical protein